MKTLGVVLAVTGSAAFVASQIKGERKKKKKRPDDFRELSRRVPQGSQGHYT